MLIKYLHLFCNLGSVFCRYNYKFHSMDVILDLSWVYLVANI
jgi:hypothetical protein